MTTLVWIGFFVFVVAMVALDLGVFHRQARLVTIKEALAWSALWVVLAMAFNVLVYFLYRGNWFDWSHDLTGTQAAVQFFTGYVVEKSLSIDNVFVIAMIFASLGVPAAQQHRVLVFGILGAVILRGLMILGGAVLIQRFDWVTYVFGGLLILTAARLLVVRHDTIDSRKHPLTRLVRRFFPVSEYEGSRFFVRLQGRLAVTPLFLALVLVEGSDALFAVDSIPAIFAITQDPFLVLTSNVFAILGLRSLYFALAGLMHRFRYLKMSLVFVLAYVGVKMMLTHHHPIPNLVSLAIIGGVLAVGILASFSATADTAKLMSPLAHELEHLVVVTYRQARRVVILLIGSSVILVGVAMIVTPGPAILVIPLGLAILALEFAWARLWLRRVRNTAAAVRRRMEKAVGYKPGGSADRQDD